VMTGGELLVQLEKKVVYTEAEARQVLRQIAAALAYTHKRNIAHRDLKPENILLMGDMETIKIADFGFAIIDKTGLETPCGTPGYVAPEIISKQTYGVEVDMWSVCVIGYILLCGYPPFISNNQAALFRKIRKGHFDFDPEYWSGVSEGAKNCIRNLLVVSRPKRYTALELLHDAWICDDSATGELVSAKEQIKKFNARQRFKGAVKHVQAAQAMRKFIAAGTESIRNQHLSTRHPTGEVKTEDVQLTVDGEDAEAEDVGFPLLPGRFGDVYAMGEKLGKGNYATVYEAVHKKTGEKWAVKVIQRSSLSAEDEEGLVQEVNALLEVDHPNVVKLAGVYCEADEFYLVLELVTGGELLESIVKKEFYSEADAQQVLRTLGETLLYLHSRGILHRDLKPENVLLKGDEENVIKLADFGFARKFATPDAVTGTPCGTPAFVAPEILNQRKYGPSVDMWSVGVLAYILLAGYPPFDHPNQAQLFKQIKRGAFEFHEEYWGTISEGAKNLIRNLLQINPARRYTAQQMLDDPWLASAEAKHDDLTKNKASLKKYNAKRKWKKAIHGARAIARMRILIASINEAAAEVNAAEGKE